MASNSGKKQKKPVKRQETVSTVNKRKRNETASTVNKRKRNNQGRFA